MAFLDVLRTISRLESRNQAFGQALAITLRVSQVSLRASEPAPRKAQPMLLGVANWRGEKTITVEFRKMAMPW